MKKILLFSLTGLMLAGCVNMDIPKKNITTEENIMTNKSGMEKYLARIYSYMPVEDFKYQPSWGFVSTSWLAAFGIEGTGEAVSREGLSKSFTIEDGRDDNSATYWNGVGVLAKPFKLLHDCNVLIENFPAYKDNFIESEYNQYLGQGYFMRAFVFYTMAKRFGGIPLVTSTLGVDDERVNMPRASEEETWDQICADFDMAISLLAETSSQNLANKYVALAYKAEAMNYAGSVAKYNSTVSPTSLNDLPTGVRTGVRVIGFDNARASELSKKYFAEAYKAANEVINSGRYSLYQKKTGSAQALYENMIDMLNDTSSPENIFVKSYVYPTSNHAFDAFASPAQFRLNGVPLSASSCPTLDFVELFDGLPRNSEGRLKVTSGNTNRDGNYIMFDKTMDLFKDAEPRLRAWIILPNDTFKGVVIETRTGVYTGKEANIAPLGNSNSGYGYSYALTQEYTQYAQYGGGGAHDYSEANIAAGKTLFMSEKWDNNIMIPYSGTGDIQKDNGRIRASGLSGPARNNEMSLTGFNLRKWLIDDPNFNPRQEAASNSDQHFILMRYADVLLAAAEAAVELSIAGAPSPDGSAMLDVATRAIQSIQTRAGANVITLPLTGTNDSRDIVRKERRKELAFEHKTKWDLRRWRVLHREGRDGFWGEQIDADMFSEPAGNRFRFRGLYPFFSTEKGQYFFDDRIQHRALKTFDYSAVDYYFAIPQDEVDKNPNIDQQPNRVN